MIEEKVILITFDWLKENKYVGVTDYCRYLVAENKFLDCHIHVYRADVLCLIVNDIKKAATIMAADGEWRKYDKTKRRRALRAAGAI